MEFRSNLVLSQTSFDVDFFSSVFSPQVIEQLQYNHILQSITTEHTSQS